MTEQKQKGSVVVIGLALFAMFFGAGNLIFPPYLGYEAGTNWMVGFLAFAAVDVGMAAVAVYAMSRGDGTISYVTGIIGKTLCVVINTAVVICIGPFLAIPRTGATTFEMAIQSIYPEASQLLRIAFCFVFFLVTFLLTIHESKVIDIIGKILTPLLVLALAVLIIKGILTPIGEILPGMDTAKTVNEGIMNGYQTMDILAALSFSIIIIHSARNKGYVEKKECSRVMMGACGVSAVLLLLVYGGLAFLGATTIGVFESGVSQSELLMMIIRELLGFGGMILLGIIVGLACLTTSIGLTSSAASYFETLLKKKVSYKALALIICVFSFVVSNFGLSMIISIASPVLNLLYPVVIILIVCSLFGDSFKYSNFPKAASLIAFIISFCTVLESFGVSVSFLNLLPMHSLGLAWVFPALIAGVIGYLIPAKKRTEEA